MGSRVSAGEPWLNRKVVDCTPFFGEGDSQMTNVKRLVGYSLAVVVLLFVFSLYVNPDLYMSVSNLFWSCFGAF